MESVPGSQLEPLACFCLPAQAVVLPPYAGIDLSSGPLGLTGVLAFFTLLISQTSNLEIQYHLQYISSYFKLSK